MDAEEIVAQWPDFLIEVLSKDIEIAHEINPKSWAIHTFRAGSGERPALSVSMYTVLAYNDISSVTIALDRDQLRDSTIAQITSQSIPRKLREQWILSVSLSTSFIQENAAELYTAHQALITRLAKYNAQRRNEHKQDILISFGDRLGEPLPSPAYLDDLNRPMGESALPASDPISATEQTGADFISNVSGISKHFAAAGLNYTDTHIADFYTALQTKGFVVLSGISGTGKSKIAQGFTRMLPNATITEVAGPDPITAHQSLQFRVSNSETWAAVSADQSHLFPRMNQNIRYDVDFLFEGGIYRGAYKARTLNFGKPTLYLILGKALTQRLRRAADDETLFAQFQAAPHEESLPQISISLDKPTSQVSTQVVESIDVSNTLFLSVRPDWRDSTSLLGYYNPLTQTYEWTDFLRFILNAADNYRSDNPIAWFVILDEMNLAHVEYYFADLLSVLESGRIVDENDPDHGFTREPLRIAYPEMVENEAPPSEVRLPPNLYIVGTVNMDETTHAFSPKVLDRAFTIELTEVDFTDYPRPILQSTINKFDDATKEHFLQAFSHDYRFPQIRKAEILEYVQGNTEIRSSLQQLNAGLAGHRFHFGYRVFDEIVQFLANAEANEMYDSITSALDSVAFMKILPKFSGSEARVRRPLDVLIEWARDPFDEGEGAVPLERTLQRALFMQGVLGTDGFVTAF